MTNYPNSQDNNITLQGVSGISDEDIAIEDLRSSTFAIEKELGITPSGVYSDVRARFDILEARINNPVSPTILSDGYVNSPLFIVNTPDSVTLSISDGYGPPTENRIDGSLYMRSDGYANYELYVRRAGAWYPMQSDLWVAGGDLAGTYLSQTVIGLRGQPLNASLATINIFGLARDGYHLTWNASGQYWEAQTGFVAGGDLASTNGPPWGRTNQLVIRLQGRDLSSVAPGGSTSSDGYGLAWDPSVSQWQPRPRAVIFDGYVARSNLRSDKGDTQSPIDNTKVGIVNFSSRSTGVAAGAVENYAAILAGDKGLASGNFSLIGNGDSHTVSGQYSTVLNGLNNTASQTHAFVLDGYLNIASGINSFVLGGASNAPAASFSGVLNGILNTITSTSTHAAIGFGSNNQITGATATYTIILGGSGNQASAQNVFLGNPTGANVQSNYSTVVTGLNNTIGTTSIFSTILGGNTNVVSAASGFSFIGTGNNITATGLYATVLNATGATANGLHTLVLNGNTNLVTGTYSTIANGLNNTISGNPAYATILDGYSNTVTSGQSSILNGNNNFVNGPNSTILNGSSNTIDVNSLNSAVLFGTSNLLVSSNRIVVAGNGNTFTNVTNAYILGQFNNVQGNSTKITGDSNIIGASSNFNRIFGNSNNLGATSIQNSVFGASNNLINATHDNIVLGSSNIVDGNGNSIVLGSTNIANSNFGFVQGQFGKSRLFGQQVHANARFTAGKIGEAQWSRLVLSGTSNAGASIPLQLQDTSPTNATFVDGYSYEMCIRVLVVNTSSIGTNPVVPARFVFDVLAHQEAGTLILDHVNQTLLTPNTSDNPSGATRSIGWSVTLSVSTNQLLITVDPELSSANYVQPANSPSARRATATIEMRELSRL